VVPECEKVKIEYFNVAQKFPPRGLAFAFYFCFHLSADILLSPWPSRYKKIGPKEHRIVKSMPLARDLETSIISVNGRSLKCCGLGLYVIHPNSEIYTSLISTSQCDPCHSRKVWITHLELCFFLDSDSCFP